ncbi:MAG: Transcriptional activator HlyU [Nitrospira sp.]|nr:Transcriptional activator HlyU [Nitrospira sp.]
MKILDAITALSALAQETRLEVFRLLVKAGPEGLTPGEMSARLGVPAPTLSFHLNHLAKAGLVERQREGRSLHYSVCFDCVRDLLAFLMEDCCQGRAEACAANEVVKEGSCCG